MTDITPAELRDYIDGAINSYVSNPRTGYVIPQRHDKVNALLLSFGAGDVSGVADDRLAELQTRLDDMMNGAG